MRRPVLLHAAVAVALAWAPAVASAAAPAAGAHAGDAWGAASEPATTGRLLVTLRTGTPTTAHAATARAVATAVAAHASRVVPQVRTLALTPRAGEAPSALAARLRADPRVEDVVPEQRFALRYVPSDPAFATADGGAAEWWAERMAFPLAWDVSRGAGARVAIIDTGIDATHPEFAGRIAETADFDDDPAHGPATVDEIGHGTHVASLACAGADNGLGIAGSGLGCSLLVAKTDLSESSVARAIIWAADRDADAINMSFGTDGRLPASSMIVSALRYAAQRGSVLVAAAADDPLEEQGDPANVLQPTDTGPDLALGLGLSVTAADATDHRAPFAGRGSQISLAAYGTHGGPGAPPGLLGAFPAQSTELEARSFSPPSAGCGCRTTFGGDARYAYLQGTSMAAPIVAGTAALVRHLNPDLPVSAVVRLLKQTARRPAGWSPELGWGILDAGAALSAARRLDRRAPVSHLRPPEVTGGHIVLRWTGTDVASPGLTPSGVARYEVWRALPGARAKRIATTTLRRLRLAGTPGARYAFFTIAIDRAGNREAAPRRPDAAVRMAPRATPRAA